MHSLISDPNVWGALPAGYAVLRALEWASRKAALLARVGRVLEVAGRLLQGAPAVVQDVRSGDLQAAVEQVERSATQTPPPEFTAPAATPAPVAAPAPDAPTEVHT